MIPGLKELLQETYNAQNELYKARNYIQDPNQIAAIERDLLRQYEIASAQLFINADIMLERAKYEGKQLESGLVPKRWRRLFFIRKANAAALDIEGSVSNRVQAFFDGKLTLGEALTLDNVAGQQPELHQSGESGDVSEPVAPEPMENAEQQSHDKQPDNEKAAGLCPEPKQTESTETDPRPGNERRQ